MKKTLYILLLVIFSLVLAAAAAESEPVSESKDAFRVPGSIVTFGAYEQDNNTENGKEPIEWIVLDTQDDRALLISLYGLDAQPYKDHYETVTWETSTLRTWLNREFLYDAFSMGERNAILLSDVDNSAAQSRPECETDGGNDTQDQVFLLSYHEAFDLYFTDDESRQCILTPYAIAREAYTSDNFRKNGMNTGSWWLRSPGSYGTLAANVYYDGTIDGTRVDFYQGTIRPVIRLNLAAEIPDRETEAREAADLYQKAMDMAKSGSSIEDAIEYIIQAAEMGNAEAQCDLGWGYWKGDGLEQSYEKARWYYRLSARQGNGLAWYNLAVMYQKGDGVEKSVWTAVDLFKKSAAAGCTEAFFTLGTLYYTGDGVPKSTDTAIEYWQAGADQGHAQCQYNIGCVYLEGMGVEKDYEKAVTYFRMALDQSLTDAAYPLALCYENGYGVEKDHETAEKYYRIYQGK